MGNFKAGFSIETSFNDPEYGFLTVVVTGEADVTCEERSGNDEDIAFVKTAISMPIMASLTEMAADKISYKDLMSQTARINANIAKELGSSSITVNSVLYSSIEPSDRSKEVIKNKDKIKALGAMTPEEIAQKAAEAQAAAQRYLDSLTPEQRRQIEERTKQLAEEEGAKLQRTIDQANAIAAGQPVASAVASSAPAAGPKFCTNCGAPSKGGKFCTNCGQPY